MRYVVIFREGPDMAPVRQALAQQHVGYLQSHADEILMAGGLRHEHGQAFVGGLWVFEVASRERAEALIANDPYFRAQPRAYELLAWGQVLS